MKTLAFLPSSRDGAPAASPITTSLSAPGLTVLLARSGEAKARILTSFQQGLSPAMRPQTWSSPSPRAGAVVIRAHDLGPTDAGEGELPSHLAAAGSPEETARTAIAMLRTDAHALLDGDGEGGRIRQLTARLREIDARLDAALETESAERARIAPLFAAAGELAERERERDRILAARERWMTLITLWPQWEMLQQAWGDVQRLARFCAVPPDAEQRHAALTARRERAERTVRAIRHEIGELLDARDALRATEPPLPAAADAVALLREELPLYRARLLQLAATRARLADLGETLAAGLRRLGNDWDMARLSEIDLLMARRDELQRWQERSTHVHSALADAQRAKDASTERVTAVSRLMNEQLKREPADGDDGVDVCWRSLWKLRAHLDEIWDVQSRAEAQARTLAEHEEELRQLDAARHRKVPRWLLRTLTIAALAAVTIFGSGAWRGYVPGAALAIATTLLVLLRLTLHVRARWVAVLERRRDARSRKLRSDIDALRRRRDAGWARAAKLTAAIRAAGARLALPDPVTLEAVETYEQDLAAQLRSADPHTELTALLCNLLDAQDEEQRAAALLGAADAERRALQRHWEDWRNEAGLAHDLDIARGEGWMEELRQLGAARAARDAAQAELAAIEPVTGAWETRARTLLAQAGGDVRSELCGSALTAELNALAERVRRETERRARRERLESALREAGDRMAAAEADARRGAEALQELLSSSGVGDEPSLLALLEGWRHWRAADERARRLQSAIDEILARRGAAADLRAELTSAQHEGWNAELRRCDAQLEQIGQRLEEAAQQRQAAERGLEVARAVTLVGNLRLEREEVRAELADAAREWKLRVLAAALLEGATQEHTRTARHELLQAASRTLATLTRGRYTAVDSCEQPVGLTVVDREGRRVPVDDALEPGLLGQISLSLVLGRAAQLASRGSALPFVLDDVLGPLSVDDAHLVAQEIAALARSHPVLYVTTAARRGDVLSAMPTGIRVFDVE